MMNELMNDDLYKWSFVDYKYIDDARSYLSFPGNFFKNGKHKICY